MLSDLHLNQTLRTKRVFRVRSRFQSKADMNPDHNGHGIFHSLDPPFKSDSTKKRIPIPIQREPPVDTKEIYVLHGVGYKKGLSPRQQVVLPRTSGSDSSDLSKSPEKYPYTSDWQRDSDESSDDTTDEEHSDLSLQQSELLSLKHGQVWDPVFQDQHRIVSQGDLKYDLGQVVLVVLPFYPVRSKIEPMVLVKGVIIDINYCALTKEDIPREIRLRTTPEKEQKWRSSSRGHADWSEVLTTTFPPDPLANRIQTYVQSYKIKLDSLYRMKDPQIKELYSEVSRIGLLPYHYDLHFQSAQTRTSKKRKPPIDGKEYDTIVVPYQYVTGTLSSCLKTLSDHKKSLPLEDQLSFFQSSIRKLDLWSGTGVKYYDPPPDTDSLADLQSSQKLERIRQGELLILDHFSAGPLDLRFIVRCSAEPTRVLALVKISDFDVRGLYQVSDYYSFQPVGKALCDVIHPKENLLDEVRKGLHEIFDPLKVYIVKKSLCAPDDITSSLYEDRTGNVKFAPGKPQHSVPKWKVQSEPFHPANSQSEPTLSRPSSDHSERKGSDPSLKYSGISLISYVRALAYLEGNCPTESYSYIFFHSKDYHELILDPYHPQFLEFRPVPEKGLLFRNPVPKESIMGVPFLCDRDPFKGKTNLNWFYPTSEFRLLHLYITSDGQHPHFRGSEYQDSKPHSRHLKHSWTESWSALRNHFKEELLCLLDLFLFGTNSRNPTLNTPFTQVYIARRFWWEGIRALLRSDPNFQRK